MRQALSYVASFSSLATSCWFAIHYAWDPATFFLVWSLVFLNVAEPLPHEEERAHIHTEREA